MEYQHRNDHVLRFCGCCRSLLVQPSKVRWTPWSSGLIVCSVFLIPQTAFPGVACLPYCLDPACRFDRRSIQVMTFYILSLEDLPTTFRSIYCTPTSLSSYMYTIPLPVCSKAIPIHYFLQVYFCMRFGTSQKLVIYIQAASPQHPVGARGLFALDACICT